MCIANKKIKYRYVFCIKIKNASLVILTFYIFKLPLIILRSNFFMFIN